MTEDVEALVAEVAELADRGPRWRYCHGADNSEYLPGPDPRAAAAANPADTAGRMPAERNIGSKRVHEGDFDVTVVGGGPAGLSAALILGRCRRRVLVCDSGEYRNDRAAAMHGFLSRDGIGPAELRRIGRTELSRYETVEVRNVEVQDARPTPPGFELELAGGVRVHCRRLLLATGVEDELPAVDGIDAFYGTSVFHCPYCDGWEVSDAPVVVYGRGHDGVGLALELTGWTSDLVLCTDGPSGLDRIGLERLRLNRIKLRQERIRRLDGQGGVLERVTFENGATLPRRAMFFIASFRQRSDLPARLRCEFTEHGAVRTGEYESTNVPGLFVAGDASRRVQLAVVAAGEGAQAAFAINTSLLREDVP